MWNSMLGELYQLPPPSTRPEHGSWCHSSIFLWHSRRCSSAKSRHQKTSASGLFQGLEGSQGLCRTARTSLWVWDDLRFHHIANMRSNNPGGNGDRLIWTNWMIGLDQQRWTGLGSSCTRLEASHHSIRTKEICRSIWKCYAPIAADPLCRPKLISSIWLWCHLLEDKRTGSFVY